MLTPIMPIEHRAIDAAGGADAGGTQFDGALVLLHVGNEVLQPVDRQILARDQNRRLVRDQNDGREIVLQTVSRMLVERHIDGVRPAAEDERVAVRLSADDVGRTDHAAGAGDVFDDHRLAQDLGHAARR